TTGADGRFELSVHPATTWTLVARPVPDNPWLAVTAKAVAPDSRNVEITIRAEDIAGCSVHGTVVRAADGEAVQAFAVEAMLYGDDGKPSQSRLKAATIEGNRFALPRVPLGRSFAVFVRPAFSVQDEWPPTICGPFIAGQEDVVVCVRVQGWGELPVRVLEADGSPARHVFVYLERVEYLDGSGRSALPVDADGRSVQKQLAPGPHQLCVTREREALSKQEVTITPRPNPELVVRLPAPANGSPRR
ncbi:MAG TPA: hypothetical protein VK348_11950, partial [Planctomycetota bacterium]|nr:hypothetical protein [Planctomycetota bacterium]